MGIPVLVELNNELRRLSIAGSGLASGDFQLKKLLPVIENMGKSTPVFKRIGENLTSLIESDKDVSSERLLELITLLNAVLYTQGDSGAAGNVEEIQVTPAGYGTSISYRVLKPVIEALTGKGPGRLEIIKKAYEDGMFKDIRLITPLIKGIDDTYGEIAELVSKILEGYGDAAVPLVKKSLDIDGGRGHARRLDLISKISGLNEKELYIKALEGGSTDVRVSAINALAGDRESEDILLEQSNEKKKEVREAALLALSSINSDRVVDRLFKAFKGRDTDISIQPIKNNTSPKMAGLLADEGTRLLELIRVGKHEEKDGDEFFRVVECMEGKRDEKVYKFLCGCLVEEKSLYNMKTTSLREYTGAKAAANTLISLGMAEGLRLLESLRDKENSHIVAYAFRASLMFRAPEEVFKTYSQYIKKGRKTYEGYEILAAMDSLIKRAGVDMGIYTSSFAPREVPAMNVKNTAAWDPDWAKLLVKLDEVELVTRFIEYNYKVCAPYLLKKLLEDGTLAKPNNIAILRALHDGGYPGWGSLMADTMRKSVKGRFPYYDNNVNELIKLLPSKYAGTIEEIAEGAGYEYIKNMLLSLAQYVRNKTV